MHAEQRPRRSLRWRLLASLLATVAVVWSATAGLSYWDARHEVGELLDAHLAQSASLLIAQTGHDLEEIDVEHSPQLHRYGRRVAFQLWEHGDVLRLHSANAPDARLSAATEGFSDATIAGERWRVFSAWDARRRFLVQVGERGDSRADIAAAIAKNMLFPLLVALPLLGVLVGVGIQRGMRPLTALNQQVAHRAPDNLRPIEVADAPAEVAPLVANLNRLFARVQASMDRERDFTADAAHELRTPLAALRAQAQVARGATDAAPRDRALANVIAGCDRASHLIEQLMTLARLEPDTFRAHREPCDLRAVAQATVAELVPAGLAKNVEIELEAPAAVVVSGDARLIGVLLRNLVDNAIRYSPAGSLVRIDVGRQDGKPRLSVTDEGPGVPAEQRALLGRRFHRLAGSEPGGAGLGLSIVKRIAELHAATLSFDDAQRGRGLRVQAIFEAEAAA